MRLAPMTRRWRFSTGRRRRTPATIRRTSGICCKRSLGWERTEFHPRCETLSVNIGPVGHELAFGAPERDPRIEGLQPLANRLSAFAATVAVPAIDPQARAWIGLMRRATLAPPIRDDRVARVFHHVGFHKATGCRNDKGDLFPAKIAHLAEG